MRKIMEKKQVKHLLDYPPRGTACGLYYPERLREEGFGTYFEKEVTCENCLGYLERQQRRSAG